MPVKNFSIIKSLMILIVSLGLALAFQLLMLQAVWADSEWETVGSAGSISGISSVPSLAIDSNGTPYIGFIDKNNGDKITVMKFNGADWETVGSPGFSPTIAWNASLAIYNDTPYIAYYYSKDAYVMKYNGTGWETVKHYYFSTAVEYQDPMLRTDGSQALFLTYRYDVYNTNNQQMLERIAPATPSWTRGLWQQVGTASLAVGKTGTPFAAARLNSGGVKVMKCPISTGLETLSGSISGKLSMDSLALDSNGTPYLAVMNNDQSELTLKKFNGYDWETVGSAIIPEGKILSVSLAIDGRDIPYVSYSYYVSLLDIKLNIVKYDRDNSRWEQMGSTFNAPEARLVVSKDEALYSTCGGDISKYDLDLPQPTLTAGNASRTSVNDAAATFKSDEAGEYYYAVVDKDAAAPDIDTSGSGTACGTALQTITLNALTGSGAKDIYIKLKNAAGDFSEVLKMPLSAYDVMTPVLTEVDVIRNSLSEAAVIFNTDKAGEYYYAVVNKDAAAPEIDASGSGTACEAGDQTLTVTDLTDAGAKDIYIKVKDVHDNISDALKMTIMPSMISGVPSLSATAGNGQAALSWTPAESAVYYMIYQSTTPGGYEKVIHEAVDSVNSYTVYGLTNDTTYYFVVSGKDYYGNYASSNEVNVTPVADSSSDGNDHDSSSDGNDHDSSSDLKTKYKATVTGAGSPKLTVSVSDDGSSVSVDVGTVSQAGESAPIVTIPEIPGVTSYTAEIPTASLIGTQKSLLTVTTGLGSMTIPANMLSGMQDEGKTSGITISQGEKSGLPDEVREAVGDRPLIQLSLEIDGEQISWNNPDAPVTVAIPYKPTAAELADPEHITVWYIDGSGNPVGITSGRYDSETGTVIFHTTHFSDYAVVFMEKTFEDLDRAAWAKKQIEVLASKDILRGISEKEYAPRADITRADYLYFLVRTIDLHVDTEENFADINRNDYYYNEIAVAKALGITNGSGNNFFDPDAGITRQDMMVLTERALSLLGRIKSEGATSVLDQFNDRSLIASYAEESVAELVDEGFIKGKGEDIDPLGNTTRAEAAALLYRIYNE